MKKALLGGEAKELVDPYFVFSFAGKEVSVMRFRFNTSNTSIILMNIQLKIKKTVIIFLFVKGAILVSE